MSWISVRSFFVFSQDFSLIISFFQEMPWVSFTPSFISPRTFLGESKIIISFIQEISWISVMSFFVFPALLHDQQVLFRLSRTYPVFQIAFLDSETYLVFPGQDLDQCYTLLRFFSGLCLDNQTISFRLPGQILDQRYVLLCFSRTFPG